MPRTVRLALLVAALAALLGFAGTAAAGTLVYGVSPAAPRQGSEPTPMYSVGTDGTGAKRILADGKGAGRVRVLGDWVYWIAGQNASVARMRLDGSDADLHFIDMPAGAGPSPAIAVTDRYVFFAYTADMGMGSKYIARADLDGGNVKPTFIAVAGYPMGLAADASHVYFSHSVMGPSPSGAIGRAGVDGSDLEESWITFAKMASDVAVDASHVYWGSSTNDADPTFAIGRADLDGSGKDESLVTGPGRASGLDVSSSAIYWVVIGSSSSAIATAGLDGSGKDLSLVSFAAGAAHPYGLGVSGRSSAEVEITTKATSGGVGTFRVRVPGPGTISLRGTRVGGTRAATTACTSTRVVKKAGVVSIVCNPNAATRAILVTRAVRVRVTITFRAKGGGTTRVSTVVRFKRISPSPVTG